MRFNLPVSGTFKAEQFGGLGSAAMTSKVYAAMAVPACNQVKAVTKPSLGNTITDKNRIKLHFHILKILTISTIYPFFSFSLFSKEERLLCNRPNKTITLLRKHCLQFGHDEVTYWQLSHDSCNANAVPIKKMFNQGLRHYYFCQHLHFVANLLQLPVSHQWHVSLSLTMNTFQHFHPRGLICAYLMPQEYASASKGLILDKCAWSRAVVAYL